jgi:hypothetical protein
MDPDSPDRKCHVARDPQDGADPDERLWRAAEAPVDNRPERTTAARRPPIPLQREVAR